MQSSGVTVQDDAVKAYNDLKIGKKYKFLIYKLTSDLKEIQVASSVEQGTYDDFVASLPANECRYGVFDFEYETG
ncbi:hypothetical protein CAUPRSCDRAFT_885, partial [Caulochytrium protostelioides]